MHYLAFRYLFIFSHLGLSLVFSFNLEARIPVIKRGRHESYFGYSVAEHQTLDELTHRVSHSWLLVGAPRDNNSQPNTSHSGALWKCPITTYEDDCEEVITDGKRKRDGHYYSYVDSHNLMPPLDDEIKDGQWLGVTVRSQGPGGKVLVCAHRYIRKGPDHQWGQGLCYTLSQYLDYDKAWEPCRGRPVNKAHEQYGFCQAGTSGLLLNDTAVIGTPGPYTWRGTLYVFSVSDDFLTRDKRYYYGPVLEHDSPVDKYSYLGMSVTAANFFGDKLSFAAGAPRSNGSGQVVMFTQTTGKEIMTVQLILNGEQFASSFGYEITSADVNGDGRPDLIVGAPFFFTSEEGGAVYIYMNNPQHCFDCNDPIKLTGKVESRYGFSIASLGDLNKDEFGDIAVGAPYEDKGSVYIYLGSSKGLIVEPSQILTPEDFSPYGNIQTFGYSLSGGLDLDGNGYPDLLVGMFDSDTVALIRSRPIIRIETTIKRDIQNIDPNRQGCSKNPNSNFTCFSFSTCCYIEAKVDSFSGSNQRLSATYKIEAEVFRGSNKLSSRVWFRDEVDNNSYPYSVKKKIHLTPDHSRNGQLSHCEDKTVFLKKNISDVLSPIKFRLSYSLIQKKPEPGKPGNPLPVIDNYPILDQKEAEKLFEVSFHKDCGDDDICQSHLTVTAAMLLSSGRDPDTWVLMLGKDHEVKLNVSVHNRDEPAYEAKLYVKHPQSLSYMPSYTPENKVFCNSFNSTLVICDVGNPFERNARVNIGLRFNVRELAFEDSHLNIVVFANSTSVEREPQEPVTLHADIIRKAELSLRGDVLPEQAFYGGIVRGESDMKYLNDIGSRVLHTYTVSNRGPLKVSNIQVAVEWPFQVGNNKPQGKWLLYLDESPRVEGGGICHMQGDMVNPLNLSSRPEVEEPPLIRSIPANITEYSGEAEENVTDGTSRTRSKRDTEMVVRAQRFTDKDGRRHEKVVMMNCLLGTAKCIKFNCTIYQLTSGEQASIKITARLWNSTLVEDYSNVEFVQIESRAKIHIPRDLHIEQDESDDETMVTTIAYPDLIDQREPEQVPVWIIVVAVVAGLLLLIILILVLWKLGFFKRRRPDPTLSGNLEKSHLYRNEDND